MLRRLSITSHSSACFLSPLMLVLMCAVTPSLAITREAHAPQPLAQRSPRDWAIVASANEVRAVTREGALLRYTMHTVDAKGERTREIVECVGGTVARLLAQNGKPLTPEEDAAERQRLQDLAASPDDFARHTRSDSTDKKFAVDLIRMMPDAMIYTPVDPGSAPLANGSRAVVFDFAPNPNWTPPGTASQALTGLRGRIWIDPRSGYVLRMQGEIFRPVNFGWGMVARVYPGGTLLLDQVNAVDNRWIFSHFEEHIKLRALMFKTIDVNSVIDSSTYGKLPGPLTLKQAIDLLLH